MINGIDIFAPRDSGLPDLSKISPAQIFNGSAIASFNAMKEQHDPYGLLDKPRYSGVEESTQKTTTIDPLTGKRVEVRKATVVEELLNGKSAKDRGHKRVSGRGTDGGYTVMGSTEEPELPDNSYSSEAPGWHPPMAPGYTPNHAPINPNEPQPPPGAEGPLQNLLLPPIDAIPPQTAALRRLPTIMLEELRNLRMIS